MKMLLLTFFVALVASAPIDDSGDAVEVVVNGLAEGVPLDVADIVDIKLKKHVGGEVAAATNLLHPFTAVGLAEAAAAVEDAAAVETEAAIEADAVHVVEAAENEAIETAESDVPLVENEIAPAPIVLPSPIPEPAVLPESVQPEVVPSPIVLPETVVPEVHPAPIVLPEPVSPEVVPSPVVIPEPVAPEVVPSPVVIPEPVAPEVVPSPVVVPEPVAPEAPEALPVPEHQFGEIYNDGSVQVTVNGPQDAGIMSTLQSWLSVVMNYFNNGLSPQTTQIV